MQPFSRPENTSPMRLIVHADDCGLTPAVSADIFACLAQGPLNSVSVIMGGSHATESLRRLAALPYTRVCLHLNLLEGRCSAPIPQVRPLVTADGVFRHSLGQLLIALACAVGSRKKALLCAIRTEFEAQIDAFTTAFPQWRQRGGLHLDGHLHVHTIPALATTMRGLFHERAPAYVRLPREPARAGPCWRCGRPASSPCWIRPALRTTTFFAAWFPAATLPPRARQKPSRPSAVKARPPRWWKSCVIPAARRLTNPACGTALFTTAPRAMWKKPCCWTAA